MYGTIISGSLKAGDALDCDVNNDGTYDSQTERFYYVTDEGSNAVLIYYTNVEIKDGEVKSTQNNYAYDSSNSSNGPRVAANQLPTKNQWNNSQLIMPGERQMTTENSGTILSNYNYEDKVARFLTYQEVVRSCSENGSTGNTSNTPYMSKCYYLLENIGGFEKNSGTLGYWLESAMEASSDYAWAVNSVVNIYHRGVKYSSTTGVRPAIVVLKSNIDY